MKLVTDTPKKKVLFVSRDEIEVMVPPPGAHLLSISDGEKDQARIDPSQWASVSFHHFVDGGYDEDLIEAYGADFESTYQGYLLPATADALRMRICDMVPEAELIVVSGRAGRSRCAAVARYISDFHGFHLDAVPSSANMTVYRLLAQDPSLLVAYRMATELANETPEPRGLLTRICDYFGLVKLDRLS